MQRICPQCRTSHSAEDTHCHRDGSVLEDVHGSVGAESDPLIGKTVADRFRVANRIGTGGMGTVYRGVQVGLERQVALKILKEEVSWDREAVTRFHREAKAMSLLVHPNTVRVYDFGQTGDGLLYLAMELLEGEGLTAKSEREGTVGVVEAVRITQQILASLHEAHSKGLIHRDLKPDNIFLARVQGHEEPVVKVLDFGIAKAWQGEGELDQLETQAGTVFGTPRYMSPEQAQGHKLDPRSDLYGVGILLYQMLVGEAPFVDDDAVVIMAKHIRDRAVPVRRAAPERPIPASLERAVMKAIEKDPNRRFQTANEFINKLEASIPHILAEQKAQRGVRRLLRTVPTPALALAGGLLFGAIAVSGYLLLSSAETDAQSERTPPIANAARYDSGTSSSSASTKPDGGALEQPEPVTKVVVVESEPGAAEVWHDGTELGTTPKRVDLTEGKSAVVELRKEGYEPATVELSSDDGTRRITLDKKLEQRRADRGRHRRPAARRRAQSSSGSDNQANAESEEGGSESASPYDKFD